MGAKRGAKADVFAGGLTVAEDPGKRIYDVVVLGGGICGLMCAWRLAEAGRSVLVLEKESQSGGMIHSEREGDWLLERGPNSLAFRENDDVHRLIKELGLSGQMMAKPIRESDRYIWREGALRRVPVSPMQMIRKSALSRRTVIRAVSGLWRGHLISDRDISVGAFFSPSLGRKAVDHVLGPAMAGIYAADPFSLSMEAVMPKLHAAAKKSHSLLGALRAMRSANAALKNPVGRRHLASFKGGMGILPEAVSRHARIAGATITNGFIIDRVERDSDETWRVFHKNGEIIQARKLVCALPSHVAANVLESAMPEISARLRQFNYAPMIVACVGVKEAETGATLNGFGYLAVRDGGTRSLGMIWNDRMFAGRAPAGHRLFTAFLGGQIDRGIQDLSDEEIIDVIRDDLRLVMKWSGDKLAMTRIWRMPAAIPLMEVGHIARIGAIRESLPSGICLTGNYMAGVSVPACIRSGCATLESLEL